MSTIARQLGAKGALGIRSGSRMSGRDYPRLVNDQSVLNMTTIKIACPATGGVEVDWGDGATSTVTCDGTLKTLTHNYTSLGEYEIEARGTVDRITEFQAYTQAWLSGDLSAFTGLRSTTSLQVGGTSISGDISHLSVLDSLSTLYLGGLAGVNGDISGISGLTSLTYLNIDSSSVSGDISVQNVSGMTGLTYLNIDGSNVSGDIAGLSGLTSLAQLRASNVVGLTGDLADLAPLTLLTTFYMFGCPLLVYTTPTALPAWGGDIRVSSDGLSSAEVDGFIIDLEDGHAVAGARILLIDGTNAARTPASNAAKAALLASGWFIQVNE